MPVLANVTAFVTLTGPRRVSENGCACTVNVGVIRPALKAMLLVVSASTTLVLAVTCALNAVNSLFTTSKVLNGLVAPTAPFTLINAMFPPSRVKLRVPAVSPSIDCSNVICPAAVTRTSVKILTMSLNTASVVVWMLAPLRWVCPSAVVNESVVKLNSGMMLPTLPPRTVIPVS